MSGAFATVIRRSIRGSLGRFLAIIGIVALIGIAEELLRVSAVLGCHSQELLVIIRNT